MQESSHFVGLDVHKDSIVIAAAESGREPARILATTTHDLQRLRRQLRKLGEPGDISVC